MNVVLFYGDYLVLGKLHLNGCTEYWLKSLQYDTTCVFKDTNNDLKHKSVVNGTILRYETLTIQRDEETIMKAIMTILKQSPNLL